MKFHKTVRFVHTIHALVFILFFGLSVHAQQVIDPQQITNDAKELFEMGAYDAARDAFANLNNANSTAETEYYMVLSAVKARHADGEMLMLAYLDNNPSQEYAQSAFTELAEYYFSNAAYDKALNNYKNARLGFDSELIFKKGYCEFTLDKYNEALISFERLAGTFSSREIDAAYFQGYIYFKQGENSKSTEYLQEALESEQYKNSSLLLLSQMLNQKQDFVALIDLVEKNIEAETDSQLLLMLADAQFALEKYSSAAQNYHKLLSQPGNRNSANYFKGGLSHFKTRNEKIALDYLSKAAIAEDSIGAYASYYLGILHVRQNNLAFAITAFENSTKFNTQVKEDAFYHQANCLMQVSNYDQAIEILRNYKSQFAEGKYADEINQMMGDAYAKTNNYDQAIAYIEQLDRLTPQLKQTYQRTSFLKGANLFNDKKFSESAEFFQKALIHDVNKEITQKTFYWMAEALVLLNDLDEAIFYYNSVAHTPDEQIYLKALYGSSYAHFNQKNYKKAVVGFKQFEAQATNQNHSHYRLDAWLRIGDCQYALKAYQDGIKYYKKAEKDAGKYKDYIFYQIGLLYRYVDNNDEAKRYFGRLINEISNSPKIAQAYFQLAQIEFEDGNENQAISGYQEFLKRFPSDRLVPFALLNQAIAYDNAGDVKRSIVNYKLILENYPRHKTANSALLGLQDKYTNGAFDEFSQYLELYKQANPDSEALENIDFETAKSNYYNQSYDKAISSLTSFIMTYPKSMLIPEAQYLVGESYYRLEQWQKALAYFELLEDEVNFGKYQKVLYRLAYLHSQLNDYVKGNEFYHRLARVSNTNRNTLNVLNGLMQNHFATMTYDSAIHFGEKLLSNPRVDTWTGSQANLIVGKSYYGQGAHDQAMELFLPLVSNTPDEHGAEAYYYVSKIYFDQAKYDRALESLFVLTNNFQAYEQWVGAAYLLMADIYIETDELFQAKATLNSLIAHAESDELKSRASEKLATIQEHVDANE